MFADYSRTSPAPDFRLQPGSPAIGKGLPADPSDGAALRTTRRPDIGALPYSYSDAEPGEQPDTAR